MRKTFEGLILRIFHQHEENLVILPEHLRIGPGARHIVLPNDIDRHRVCLAPIQEYLFQREDAEGPTCTFYRRGPLGCSRRD